MCPKWEIQIRSDQGLCKFIFINRIVKLFSKIMLLWPGYWGTLSTRVLVNIVKGHLVGCVLDYINFWKTIDKCDHRVWLLKWLKVPLLDLTSKSGATAVTQKARLGDRNRVFRFSKIYALINTANQMTLRNLNGTSVERLP